MTWQHSVRCWSQWLEARSLSPATIRTYRRTFVNFLADTLLDPEQVTERDVVAYLAGLGAKGPQKGLVLRALRSYYSWAGTPLPIERLPTPRPKFGRAPSLDPGELEQVLIRSEALDPRARPALELAYCTGARVGSLCALLPEDVRLDRRDGCYVVDFRVTKHDKPYSVPLGTRGEKAYRALLDLIDYTPPRVATRRPTLLGIGPSQFWNWVSRSGEAAGVKVWPHLLRHTFLQRLAEDPTVADITWIELANHRDGSQRRRYSQATMPMRRRAVDPL